MIKEILLKIFKFRKFKSPIPYNEEFTVFVKVKIDNLNEFSKLRLSKAKRLDKINIAMINEIKTKKDIFASSS